MTEKPLHVQAAEALGWATREVPVYHHQSFARVGSDWLGCPPEKVGEEMIPRYDTDWSATGPLIEQYSLSVAPNGALASPGTWLAYRGDLECAVDCEDGDTPLIAVCNLILALAKAGKL